MEENEKQNAAVSAFAEALSGSSPIYYWRYDPEGNVLSTNCPVHVYHKIFEQTGCLAYMVGEGKNERTPLILAGALGILWCAVYEWEDDVFISCHVLGPVFHDEVNDRVLNDAIRKYQVDPAWRNAFVSAMYGIPAVTSILFFQYAVMLHYFVTGEKIERSDLRFQQRETENKDKKKAGGRNRHRTYETEQALLKLVRDGNLNYKSVIARAGQISSGVGIQTADPVRRAILSSSNFVALCTRAAIEGGLTPDTAYTVGDSYIQSLTECRTIADVRTVNHAMYEDFIARVHRQRMKPTYSRQVQNCAAYIETHPEEDLTLEKLAREVGYSEYHLSRRFKEETGMNIREYIRKARVERAKLLLETTDLSIREIGEQLNFCAPSHLAKSFREVTGMLPQEYRKEHQK